MRLVVLPLAVLLCSACLARGFEDQMLEDDDFAEFEQFDADDEPAVKTGELFYNTSILKDYCSSSSTITSTIDGL